MKRIVLCFLFCTLAAPASAQYPAKPLRFVMPYPPGGSSEILARPIAIELTKNLGQPVIIDYKPGAGASIGTIYVSKAVPDGYVILSVTSAFTVYPAFYAEDKLPYDPVKDFAPISLITKRGAMLAVHPSLPVRTFPEYIDYARTNPGKINFGTTGAGGILHIIGAWLHSATNTKVTFIHYKGAAPMYTDFVAGRVTAAPAIFFLGMPYVRTGKLIPIANMSLQPSKYLPDYKTINESGIPGFEYASWSAFLGPSRTPEAIVKRWSAEFAKIAKSPDVIKRMDTDGADMVGSTPEEFGQVIISETTRYRRIVQDNNIKLEE